jgi:hypothetical protein
MLADPLVHNFMQLAMIDILKIPNANYTAIKAGALNSIATRSNNLTEGDYNEFARMLGHSDFTSYKNARLQISSAYDAVKAKYNLSSYTDAEILTVLRQWNPELDPSFLPNGGGLCERKYRNCVAIAVAGAQVAILGCGTLAFPPAVLVCVSAVLLIEVATLDNCGIDLTQCLKDVKSGIGTPTTSGAYHLGRSNTGVLLDF